MKSSSRRRFLKTAAVASVPLFDIVPSRVLGMQGPAPSDTIALGHIGIGGRGRGFLRPEAELGKGLTANPNLGGMGRVSAPARSVALCDVDAKRLDEAATRVGGRPKTYKDFRKLLDDKSVDAVVIASPDHWHALMTILACQAGKDVYCEKPACNTIEEGRAMVNAAERYARVVQIGSQGRSQPAAWQAGMYVRNGQIGKVKEVLCWHYASPDGDWTPDAEPPSGLDYDMWVGPARWLPYNSKHTHGQFRWMIDFGGGQIRDRGAHVMSIANWIMDCDHTGPVSVDATGEPPHDGMYDSAVTMQVAYEFKNPDWRLVWAQPGIPSKELDARYGAVYHGDKGHISVTLGDGQGTATDPRVKEYQAPWNGAKIFQSPGHIENFIDCIKSREKPIMHMEAAHRVASLCILGNVGFQLQRKLEWDPVAERVKNDDEANRMLSRPGRGPWHL
ncbi:MAG: Gfo/Idh/MocA family oxidoreductase [Candidatus Solibacter usitatus]|nr:Gfo/Idh/MocA family oxidoreductase [Candidatus Solibacter usitatus]